jgi:hypothetical protein
MFPYLMARRHPDRPSARRCRAGRSLRVEDLEGRRLLSGSNFHHRYDATPVVIATIDLVPRTDDAVHSTGANGTGGGAGKVKFQ